MEDNIERVEETMEETQKPNYLIMFTVPTIADVEGLVLEDTALPFTIIKFKDEDRYALVVASMEEEVPPLEMMSTVWLKFRMGVMAFSYEDFMKVQEDATHQPANLYATKTKEE